MANTRKIDLPTLARMYDQGQTLAQMAAHFDVSMPAVHYALQRAGVERNRQLNPGRLSWDPKNIRQRIKRHQERLGAALSHSDKRNIRLYSDLIAREQAILRDQERNG